MQGNISLNCEYVEFESPWTKGKNVLWISEKIKAKYAHQ